MKAAQLITILEAFGFTPEDYSEQLYGSGSYNSDDGKHFDNDKIQSVVGKWEEKEKEKEVPIDTYGYVENHTRTVLFFPEQNIYLAAHKYSGSYGRETWTSWYEVVPKPSTEYIKVEDLESNESSYNSY